MDKLGWLATRSTQSTRTANRDSSGPAAGEEILLPLSRDLYGSRADTQREASSMIRKAGDDFLCAAVEPDLNTQREADCQFGAGQAVAPDGWDPSDAQRTVQ